MSVEDIVNIIENTFVLGEIGKLMLYKEECLEDGDMFYSCVMYFNVWNDDSWLHACTTDNDVFRYKTLYLPNTKMNCENEFWIYYENLEIQSDKTPNQEWIRDEEYGQFPQWETNNLHDEARFQTEMMTFGAMM